MCPEPGAGTILGGVGGQATGRGTEMPYSRPRAMSLPNVLSLRD